MLYEITIADLGVIQSATAEFSPGLTVVTGETGAGKTMVVTGLRLLSGGRADASRVRDGAEKAVVEGRFGVRADHPAMTVVTESGGSADDDGEVIAVRTVLAAGRSKAYLGGRSVPAANLGEFSSELLTIHGQNDQLRLLSPERQLAAVDRFDPEIAPLRSRYESSFRHWRSLVRQLKARSESSRELAQEIDRLRFGIEEIADIDPQPGEDEQLVSQINRLQDIDALREAALLANTAIAGSEEQLGVDSASALDALGQAHRALAAASDEQLRELGSRLHDASAVVADISAELAGFLAALPADAQLLEQLLLRQQELKGLTRKYAPDIAGVVQWQQSAQQRLAEIDISPEALDALRAEVAAAETVMLEQAADLTTARTAAAAALSQQVSEELHGLAMPKARFEVVLRRSKYSTSGADEVEFCLAANDAATAAPLASSASGGELSRVMLALEVILSSSAEGSTLVFDEVDAGVGGRAAVEIGRRLAALAEHHQVIVVTHLPQVAAYGTSHVHISKDIGDSSVTSVVRTLNPQERTAELARMLAGLDDSDTGRAHAAELLSRAQAEIATRAPSPDRGSSGE